VARATVSQGGQTRKLVRDPAGGWSADAILNAAIEETFHRLGNLHVVSWVDRGPGQMEASACGRGLQPGSGSERCRAAPYFLRLSLGNRRPVARFTPPLSWREIKWSSLNFHENSIETLRSIEHP